MTGKRKGDQVDADRVFDLHDTEGRSYTEIAERIGIAPSRVGQIVRKKLAQRAAVRAAGAKRGTKAQRAAAIQFQRPLKQ